MMSETVKKAEKLVEEGKVRIGSDTSPSTLHVVVESKGKDVDVWLKDGEWSCNSVTQRRKKGGDKWGCVMNVKADKKIPFCSHSLAAYLWARNERLI